VSWTVDLARDAKKEFARLPASVQRRVARVLLALESDPFPSGCKKLKNRDGWRLRIGDYRILYFVDKNVKQIIVGVIGSRQSVYKR